MAHQVVHTSCYFEGMAKETIFQLMRDQSSCARAAYQTRVNKTCRNVNEIRHNLISRYSKKLKVIMIYDAIVRTDSPAVIHPDGTEEYWHNNKCVSKEVYYSKMFQCKMIMES